MSDRPAGGHRGQRALARSVFVSAVLPWVLFVLLRSHVGSDAEALAIAGAIPVAWVLLRLGVTRRVEWIGVASVAVFAVTVLVSLLAGGSSLPFKLRESVVTGLIGLACLISVLVHRPLPVMLARVRSLRGSEQATRLEQAMADPVRRRVLAVVTTLSGVTLLLIAAARAVLALTLPTAAFLAVVGVTSWSIAAAGVVSILVYLRRHRPPGPAGPGPAGPGPGSEAATARTRARRWPGTDRLSPRG